MAECDDEDVGLEGLARAFAAGHVTWLGLGGGLRTETGATWERAVWYARGINGFDLALLLWGLGVDNRELLHDARAAVLLEAQAVEQEIMAGRDPRQRREWKGKLLVMREVAMVELSPRGRVSQFGASERWELAKAAGFDNGWESWRKRWQPHYLSLLDRIAQRDTRARLIWHENRRQRFGERAAA